jgi:hypothetical protein
MRFLKLTTKAFGIELFFCLKKLCFIPIISYDENSFKMKGTSFIGLLQYPKYGSPSYSMDLLKEIILPKKNLNPDGIRIIKT